MGAVVIPGARGDVVITHRLLRQMRWTFGLTTALVAALLIGLALTLPRSLAYTGLVEENLALRTQLQEINTRMSEVDRLLLRLRLYDAQIRSLAEPDGDHGPLPEEAFANGRLLSALEDTDGQLEGPSDEMYPAPHPLDGSDLRPAETWALAVSARVDTFVTLFTRAEPDLNQLVAELEDLRALEIALPHAWPARGDLTSGFGWRRHPLGNTWRFHSGLDIGNKRGTPIYAAARGKVIRADYNSGYGRMIEIEHGYGITSLYAHCTSLRVRKGQTIDEGQFIATMGSTGRATGPHLHFEVRLDGHAVDPLDYLPR